MKREKKILKILCANRRMCKWICAVLRCSVVFDSCNPMDCSPLGFSVHGDSPGKNTGVGCLALLQGIFSTQGSNRVLPHCRRILYCLSHQGSPQVYMDYVNVWYLGGCTMYNVKYFYICIHSVEKAMAPHYSTLAWKIPWMEEPGGLQSMGSLGVRHDWVTSLSLFTFKHWRRKWQPTPVFLPGESQGRGSLLGCRLWGRTELDTTEVT